MPLLRLPAETLVHIFNEVGSPFFSEDLGRLTVCKLWFEYALPTLFRSILLSEQKLQRLIGAGLLKAPSPLESSLQSLTLELIGNPASGSILNRQGLGQDIVRLDSSEASGLSEWRAHLFRKNSLAQLATAVPQFRRLRTLRIEVRSTSLSDDAGDYLSLPTLQAFLSVRNLSVLEIDINISARFLQERDKPRTGEVHHICPAISALLPTLQTLHIRIPRICPDILRLQGPDDGLRLSEVIIGLNLRIGRPMMTAQFHSTRCNDVSGGFLQLKDDMRKEAEALAARMQSPKCLRIQTHNRPHFSAVSLDVLTGKTTILKEEMYWLWAEDDVDAVIEHSEEDDESEESEISSLSSFPDD
jgi:hypothetical protein